MKLHIKSEKHYETAVITSSKSNGPGASAESWRHPVQQSSASIMREYPEYEEPNEEVGYAPPTAFAQTPVAVAFPTQDARNSGISKTNPNLSIEELKARLLQEKALRSPIPDDNKDEDYIPPPPKFIGWPIGEKAVEMPLQLVGQNLQEPKKMAVFEISKKEKAVSSFKKGTPKISRGGAPSTDHTVGLCLDMCPKEERQRRTNESDVHKLEILHPGVPELNKSLRHNMIKKLQRSSADHELKIPHLMRTPRVLVSTIYFIETHVMEKDLEGPDPRFNDDTPPEIDVYLFVWDRFRMIAKDFILQLDSSDGNSQMGGSILGLTFLLRCGQTDSSAETVSERVYIDRLCVECHERMCRWHIMMEHHMSHNDEFNSAHKQQNGEQLFRVLKSLDEFYFGSTASSWAGKHGSPLNVAEFCGYYIIYQIDNGKEVALYIRGLPKEILESDAVKFAIQVWVARKTKNYALFFKLLYYSTYLQACCMFRYVGNMRLLALKTMVRTYRAGKIEAYHPIGELIENLMFEDDEDVCEFLEHCGVEVVDGSEEEGPCAVLVGQSIEDNLPVDKNGQVIYPRTRQMVGGIEVKVEGLARKDVCRGVTSEASTFALSCDGVEEEKENEDDDENGSGEVSPPSATNTFVSKVGNSIQPNNSRRFPDSSSIRGSRLGTNRPDLDLEEQDRSVDADNIAISDDEEDGVDEEQRVEEPKDNHDITLSVPKAEVQSPIGNFRVNMSPRPQEIPTFRGTGSGMSAKESNTITQSLRLNIPKPERRPLVSDAVRDAAKPNLASSLTDVPLNSTNGPGDDELRLREVQERARCELEEQRHRDDQARRREEEELRHREEEERRNREEAKRRHMEEEELRYREEQTRREAHIQAMRGLLLKVRLATDRCQKRSHFRQWATLMRASAKRDVENTQRVFLLAWRWCWRRKASRRRKFKSDICAIDSVRQSVSIDSSVVIALTTSTFRKQARPRLMPNYKEPIALAAMVAIIGCDYSISPPQIVGESLLAAQRAFLQSSEVSDAVTHYKIPTLLWKCAVFSSASAPALWTHEDSLVPNLFRCLLSNVTSVEGHSACIGSWDETVHCEDRLHLRHTSSVLSVRVVDACLRSLPETATSAHCSLLIVDVDDLFQVNQAAIDGYLHRVEMYGLQSVPPLVLLLTHNEPTADGGCVKEDACKWCEVTAGEKQDGYADLVGEIMRNIARALGCAIPLYGAYVSLVSIDQNRSNGQLFSQALLESLNGCLYAALTRLAEACSPCPVVCRANVMFDLHTDLNDCIWTCCGVSEDDASFAIQDSVRKINCIVKRYADRARNTIHVSSSLYPLDIAPEFCSPSAASMVRGALARDTAGGAINYLPRQWFNLRKLTTLAAAIDSIALPEWPDHVDIWEGAIEFCSLLTSGRKVRQSLLRQLPDMLVSGYWQRALASVVGSFCRESSLYDDCDYLLDDVHFGKTVPSACIAPLRAHRKLATVKRSQEEADEEGVNVDNKRLKYSDMQLQYAAWDKGKVSSGEQMCYIPEDMEVTVALGREFIDTVHAERNEQEQLNAYLKMAIADDGTTSETSTARYTMESMVDVAGLIEYSRELSSNCKDSREAFEKHLQCLL